MKVYKEAFCKYAGCDPKTCEDLEDNIYACISVGGSDQENLFIQKQKMCLIFGNVVNRKMNVADYIKNAKITNLLSPLTRNDDELLNGLPLEILLDLLQYQSLFPTNFLQSDVRKNIVSSILDTLAKATETTPKTLLLHLAEQIELGAWLYTILIAKEFFPFNDFAWTKPVIRKVYLTILNSITSSLSFEKYNSDLIQVLISKELNPLALAFLPREKLLPKLYEYKAKAIQEALNGMTLKEDYTIHESDIICEQCGKNYVKPMEIQMRSADEPMTVFYMCKYPKCPGRKLNNGRPYQWKDT